MKPLNNWRLLIISVLIYSQTASLEDTKYTLLDLLSFKNQVLPRATKFLGQKSNGK